MNIIILLIIAIASLSLGHIISRPIDNSANLDISINRKSYQHKIDEYLNKKWGKKEPLIFNIHLIKEEIPKEKLQIVQDIKTIEQPVRLAPKYNNRKTYLFNGYSRFKDSKMYVHRWVMEKKLDRKLTAKKVVHHIDGNKLNNNEENLMLFPNQAKHHAYHKECKKRFGTWCAIIPNYKYEKINTFS